MNSTISLCHRFLHRLQQNNPFYLLSAACMLAGCLAVTNSLSWVSIPLGRLLILIATLNVYEAALLALAAYLIRVRQVGRDGVVLLILEAFFLIDITFLNAEVATSLGGLGLVLNILLFLAAVAKLAVIVSLFGQSPRDGRFAALVLQLAVLFAIPLIFRRLDHGDLSPRVFYAAWWVIGLLIPLSQEIARTKSTAEGPSRIGVSVYQSLPWLSLILHVSILHYVYNVTFYGANAAPILLALAFVLHRSAPSTLVPRKDLLVLRLLLPAAAVLVSLNNPYPLCLAMTNHPALSLTPTRLAICGAYLTYVLCFVRPYLFIFVAAGVAVIPAWILGPTLDQMSRASSAIWDWAANVVDHLIPRTTLDWGVSAIAAAFAFLGMGAIVSLARRIQLPSPTRPLPEVNEAAEE
jgi:hypothetical protein